MGPMGPMRPWAHRPGGRAVGRSGGRAGDRAVGLAGERAFRQAVAGRRAVGRTGEQADGRAVGRAGSWAVGRICMLLLTCSHKVMNIVS